MPPKTRKRKSPVEDEDDEDVPTPTEVLGSSSARMSASEAKRRIRKQADELVKLIDTGHHAKRTFDFGKVLLDKTAGEDIYEQASACVDEFHRIIEEYKMLNSGSHGIAKPQGMRWEQDVKDLRELDQKAMEMSIRALNGSILTRTHGVLEAGKGNDIDRVAWEMLVEARPKSMEETWGGTAEGVMRAAAGLVKLLPANITN